MLRHRIENLAAPAPEEIRTASRVLGAEHPLTRAAVRVRLAGKQALVAAAPLPGALAGTALQIGVAPVVLVVTLVVLAGFALAWTSARRVLLNRTQDHIVSGTGMLAIPTVARERRRLASRGERERLARWLEQALDDAWGWYRFPPRARPLAGTDRLRETDAEARAVIACLRRDEVRVQGVALTARLLLDGERSPLYGGNARALKDELGRIRFLLSARQDERESVERFRIAA